MRSPSLNLMRFWAQICLCLFSHTALAQQSPAPSKSPTEVRVAQDSSSLLEYARFLRDEDQAHRAYLEKLYTTTTILLTVLVAGGIGLISFFQFKTKKDVQEAVNDLFSKTVGKEVKDSSDRFMKNLAQMEEGQKLLAADVRAVQMALKGNLTKYEHEYLKRLADPRPFASEVGDFEYHYPEDNHHYTHDIYPRLKRLDDLGLIRPTEMDGRRSLMRIVEDHKEDERLPNENGPRFKLREYAEITEEGRKYLELADFKYQQ